MSVDLARQIGTVLEASQNHIAAKVLQNTERLKRNATHEERQQIVHLAKTRIQNSRNCHMQVSGESCLAADYYKCHGP